MFMFIMFLCITAKFIYSYRATGFSFVFGFLNSTVVNSFEDIFWYTQGYFHWNILLLGVKFLGHMACISSALVAIAKQLSKGSISLLTIFTCIVEESGCSTSSSTLAAATAKSLQSCSTLWDPIDGSLPGSPVPGILQARTLEWVAIFFSNAWKWKVKVKSLGHVRSSATQWTAAYQAPLSMGFSGQEYWSGVPLPSPTST